MSVGKKKLEELVEDHHHLIASVERLSELLAAGDQPATAVTLLDDLHGQLVRHFAHEEEGGYFRRLLAASPHLRPEAEELLGQHPVLLIRLEEARSRASRATADGAWGPVRRSFGRFVGDLHEHEQREERLLQEGHATDLGAKD